jgi:DHA1 family tetracycline resistance protein-like MFS transporter
MTTKDVPLQSEVPITFAQRNRLFILATGFLTMAGIGILNPVAPFIVGGLVAPQDVAFVVALLFTAYSLSQFLAVPVLGALSDRYGRRPVMLISLLGSAVGFWFYGIGGALFMLFLGRIIDGLTGGNLAVLNAYATDDLPPEQRTRMFAMLGAATGMGFVIGPVLGGLLYRLTDSYILPIYAAALLMLLNTLWGWFAMPESLSAAKRAPITAAQLNPFTQLFAALRDHRLQALLLITFLWMAAYSVTITNFSVLAEARLGWQPDMIGIGFLVWGVVSIVAQAGLVPRLAPRFGERALTAVGLLIMAAGFVLVGIVAATSSLPLVWLAIVITSLGAGLVTPALTGLFSQAVSEQEQGRAQGSSMAAQALARVIAPVWAGYAYAQISAPAPYWSGALILLVTLALVYILPSKRASA